MKKKITIHDIARQLHVSATTVSFVLNGRAQEKRISDVLVQRILKHVNEVGYQLNMVAKSLRTGKTKTIGMLVEDISDPFFSSIARSVEINAYKLGYKIFYSSTENDTEKTKTLIQLFRERQVDGYIIAPPPGIEEDIRLLLKEHFPVIIFDRYFPDVTTDNVIIDNFDGSYKAIQHFLERGHTRIGFITLDSQQTQMQDRLDGYAKAMKEKGLKQYILKIPFRLEQEKTVKKMRGFFEKYPELDAVLFATNYLAISGLETFQGLGLKIPDDLVIIGFDDNTHFSLFTPSITAVAQPIAQISEQVVKRLFASLSNDGQNSREKETIVLNTELIVRSSSIRVKKKTDKRTALPQIQ